jgi:hypothetical protein
VGGVRLTNVYRADLSTLRGIMSANALGAFIRINDIYGIALADCLIWALRFAGSTTNAILTNLVCHKYLLIT